MLRTAAKVPYAYLPLEAAHVGAAMSQRVADVIGRGDFTLGREVQEFETAFAKVAGTQHAVGVSSGTDALILALKAWGIGPGARVVTVPNTFYATVAAIIHVGAQPVFVDVGPDYLIDQAQIAALSPQPDLALVVDLTGNPVPCKRYIAGKHNSIPVIRDAAQSVGSNLDGWAGNGQAAVIACYSLHPLKNVHVIGDGGIVATDNEQVAARVRLLRNHGLQDRDTCIEPGFNLRLATVQAAAGQVILDQVGWITRRRNEIARWYDEAFRGIAGIMVPPRNPEARQVFHTYVIQVSRRPELMAHLAQDGIETKVHYPIPLHLQPGFRSLGYKHGAFPVTEAQAERILSLPCNQYLTDAQVNHVIASIRAFYCS